MIRADRIALAAGGLLTRAALGFLGLAILIGWNVPTPGPAAPASSPPGDPEQAGMTVMLRVPEGSLVKNLTVVDATGQEVAVVTRWLSGMTTVLSRRRDGVGVSYHLNIDGSARMRVQGPAQVAVIDSERDGTTQVIRAPASPVVVPLTTTDIEPPDGMR